MTDSSSAWIVSTPAQFMSEMKYSWISRQFSSRRSCASICSAHRFGASWTGCEPISTSNESASEWAGSVLMTMVRWPAAAALAAVAAATVVLPTPPFPVNSRTRIRPSLARGQGRALSRARPPPWVTEDLPVPRSEDRVRELLRLVRGQGGTFDGHLCLARLAEPRDVGGYAFFSHGDECQ